MILKMMREAVDAELSAMLKPFPPAGLSIQQVLQNQNLLAVIAIGAALEIVERHLHTQELIAHQLEKIAVELEKRID